MLSRGRTKCGATLFACYFRLRCIALAFGWRCRCPQIGPLPRASQPQPHARPRPSSLPIRRSFKDEPLPVNGYVTLSDKPGFGLELNREANKLTRPFPRAERDFATVEAEKDARTPDQEEWLSRAEKIPIRHL